MALSITQTIPLLEELHSALDQAFWESSQVQDKDKIYDIISLITMELSELGKLSIQDHDFEYEPICREFSLVLQKLLPLRKELDDIVLRSSTASKLDSVISRTLEVHNGREKKS